MSDSHSNELENKSNPWLGFAFLAPLTVVLFVVSRTGLEGTSRAFVVMGLALIQAAIAVRFLLGVQKLHRLLKALLLLIAFVTFLLLLMPAWQLFEGTARPASQWEDPAATEEVTP